MRRIILSLAVAFGALATARAQFPVQNVPAPPIGQPYAVEIPNMEYQPYVGPLWTANFEYLLWFLKPTKFGSPVLGTTTDPNLDLGSFVTGIGANSSNYASVVGTDSIDRGPYSGGRLSITRALPVSYDRCAHAELIAFWLPQQDSRTMLQSTPDGNPAILVPFRSSQDTPFIGPPGDNSAAISGNIGGTRFSGSARVYTSTQLWGGELNYSGPFYHSEHFGFEGLFGFRYLGMQDLAEISTASSLSGGITTYDEFRTTNHFYGGQVGLRFLCSDDRWAAMLQTKLGLGNSNSNLAIRGENTLDPSIPATSMPGGFFTGPTNLGNTSTNVFGVVADLNASIRFALSSSMGISVGYNFLYWSGVYRAAEQVSGTINPTRNPVLNALTGPGEVGPNDPRMQRDLSDIWAHGVNFGLDIRF